MSQKQFSKRAKHAYANTKRQRLQAQQLVNSVNQAATAIQTTQQKLNRQLKQLSNALTAVRNTAKTVAVQPSSSAFLGSVAPVLAGGQRGPNYTVGMVGSARKKGTVHLAGQTPSVSTKVLASAFQRLLSANSELGALRAEVERIKRKQ